MSGTHDRDRALLTIASALAFELNQVAPGNERRALREQFDGYVDEEVRCATINLAGAVPQLAQLLVECGFEQVH